MIDALINSFAVVIIGVISLYKWVIIIGALLSWVNPDPYNPIVQMIDRLTSPAYRFVRKFIPTVFGGIDLAPIILIFILVFLETFLTNIFASIL
jgi:YggT family protein